jgi:S1-C subfamily serine protease
MVCSISLMKNLKALLYSLMLLGVLAICLLVAFVLTMPGGPFEGAITLPLTHQDPSIYVSAQTPPLAGVGDDIVMSVFIENLDQIPVQIDEIRIGSDLLSAAVVTNVVPGTLSQTHYQDYTGFYIDQPVQPGERQLFEFDLVPLKPIQLTGKLQVISNQKVIAEAGVRLEFVQSMAVFLPTDTPTFTPSPTPTYTPIPPTLTPTPRPVIPYQAVVKITAKYKYASILKGAWSGSGTIISPDGVILTNAHLVLGPPGPAIQVDYFIISLTIEPDQPPIDSFIAEEIYADRDLDLALLRITTDLKYKDVDPENLFLTSVELGDSDQLQLGEPLTILGYPAIGGDTITVLHGVVGGFTLMRNHDEISFIKTSTSITGGASGGLALDRNGRIVAIPTQLGYGGEDYIIDCERVADTNLDATIDNNDFCVPAGGFINAMRPINLAKPMIESYTDIKVSTPDITITPSGSAP